jgi:hypothetical protein
VNGKDTTLFLSKGLQGGATTPDIKAAAACAIQDSKLTCEGKSIGVNLGFLNGLATDMGVFEPASGNALLNGFVVDGNNVLHWENKNKQFDKVLGHKDMVANTQLFPNGEAAFALYNGLLAGGKTVIYANLGCTNIDHLNAHGNLFNGQIKAIPL